MKFSIILLTMLAASTCLRTAAQSTISDSLPGAKWARPRHIDVQHVVIDLKFDWQKRQASGTTTIDFSPLHSIEEVSLDAAMLTILSIKLGNNESVMYTYDGSESNDALKIKLDRKYQSDEKLQLKKCQLNDTAR